MARYGFVMHLKGLEVIDDYERLHQDIGDEVREAHRRAGMRNYTIFRDNLTLFAYFEADDPQACFEHLKTEPIMEEWWAKTNPLMLTEDDAPKITELREVFHMD